MKVTRRFPLGLITGFLLVCGSAAGSFGQSPVREFTNPANGLRYQIVNRDTSVVVDKMAAYPGGTEALLKYLRKGIKYPAAVDRKGIEGLVKAKILIGTSGEVAGVTITESLHPQLDSVVTDMVRKMPAWTPSYQGDKPIRTTFMLPVRFTHLTEGGWEKIRSYQNGGVSFRHFKNWEVSSLPLEKGTEVKFSRKGLGKGGTVFITWQHDTASLAERMQAELGRLSGKSAGALQFSFGKPKASTYNKHKALRATGFMTLDNLVGAVAGRMTLEVYTFNAGDRNFVVKIMEFEEDKNMINSDLGVIEAGFSYPAAN